MDAVHAQRKMLVILVVLTLVLAMTATAEAVGYAAYVRVVQLSPNALDVDVELQPLAAEFPPVAAPEWQNMRYLAASPWVEVVPDAYQLVVNVDGIPLTKTVNLSSDAYYTIDLSGLVIPEELSQLAEVGLDKSVWQWLRELVAGQDPTHVMLFQPRTFRDNLSFVYDGEVRLRLVHAAPGIEPLDLAVVGESGSLIHSIAYGQASDYREYRLNGPLEVRLAGSRVAIDHEELAHMVLRSGHVYTIFVAGTPTHVDAPNLAVLLLDDACLPRIDANDYYSVPQEMTNDEAEEE